MRSTGQGPAKNSAKSSGMRSCWGRDIFDVAELLGVSFAAFFARFLGDFGLRFDLTVFFMFCEGKVLRVDS